LFGGALSVSEARKRHRDDHVGCAAADVLALAAVTTAPSSAVRPRLHSAVLCNSNRLPVS
jgi:hypothetical protein